MADPVGESERGSVRLYFDRRVKLEFHGSTVTSDAGLLAYRELDNALGLTVMAGNVLADARTGKNGRHALVVLLRLGDGVALISGLAIERRRLDQVLG